MENKINMKFHINDIFTWCNDIDEMRQFYTDILGLKEAWYQKNAENGSDYLGYKLGNNQTIHFIHRNEKFSVDEKWSYQPSSEITGGKEKTSWTLEIDKATLEKIYEKCKESNCKIFQDKIEDRGTYMAFTVLDPMGRTVDLYYLK